MRWLAGAATLSLVGLLLFSSLNLSPSLQAPELETMAGMYGVRNAVAAVVLGARLWDTLFEVLVFAMAMVGVRIALRPLGRAQGAPPVPESHLLSQAARLLWGPIAVFALYLAASGHLGPGGGFPAGAILGSGLLLLALAQGTESLAQRVHEGALERLEYAAVALLLCTGTAIAWAGTKSPSWFVAANLLVGLEVAIGAWVVLHRFVAHRGEL
ncbi:MAG: Multisubunit Na+/H+ antiporter, MnhB subunit [Acetothermia bacterium 64_32]|nr:MAG: Multisubunit Na+/H+ antiporter, MnhB subunit [Acetothermia bacterium 64_32]HAF71267.1 hypothetical protein [Candidatus Acetothermia bacterium]